MSGLIKKYPLCHETDDGTEGPDIFDAISMSPSGVYVDVPGLGLVEITQQAAMAAIHRLHDATGANRFALAEVGEGRGVCDWSRILMRWM